MKKFIIILFTLFICCNLVKADCGFLSYTNYEVIVSNENGAVIYEEVDNGYKKTNEIIPYNTKLKVDSDNMKLDNDYILHVYSEDEKYGGNVKASDLQNINDYKKEKKTLEKSEYYTYEDTEVRSGPGILYDIVGIIKADTNVYFEKNINLDGINSGAWKYISDGNIGGYIYFDTCSGNLPIKLGKLIKNKNDYYYIGNDDYGIGLKRYDKVNIKYVVYDYGHHKSYYVEFNNKNLLIEEEFIVEKFERELIFLSLDNEYTELFDINDKSLNKSVHLKIGQKYKIKYRNVIESFDNYYIEVDGKMYIVVYNLYFQDNDLVVYDENKIYNIEYKGKKIEAYKILNRYDDSEYDNTEYYNSKYGIINLDEENEEDNKEEENESIIDNNQNNNTPDDNINNDIENNVSDENENKDDEIITGVSSKQYVTWCLIGSIILSAISEILILVLNKSKN